MAGKPPKIKPSLNKHIDFSVDGSHRQSRTGFPFPHLPHRLDSMIPTPSLDPLAATQRVSISPGPMTSLIDEVAIAASAPSFKDYWIPAWKGLDAADAAGIVFFKQRQYVSVAEGYFVQVAHDAESGLFRATVVSELHASGPMMEPGADGKLWRPVERTGDLPDDGSFQLEPPRTIEERLGELFPTLTEEARTTLRRERSIGDSSLAMARLEAEHLTLLRDLGEWTAEVPSHHPVTRLALTSTEVEAQRTRRELFAQELQDNWSRKATIANPYTSSTLEYDLDILGSMPRFSADFSHVRELSLASTSALSGSDFLASFPGVQYLSLSGFALRSFPVEVFQMRALATLTLDNCDIQLSPASVEGLAHIEELTLLDLSENPLGLVPDISYMRRLDSLYLSSTGLTEVPVGLFDIESLGYADLMHNEIAGLPRELFDVPDDRNVIYDFRNNPLDEESLQRVTVYLDNAGLDRQIRIQVADQVWVAQQNPGIAEPDSGMESAED